MLKLFKGSRRNGIRGINVTRYGVEYNTVENDGKTTYEIFAGEKHGKKVCVKLKYHPDSIEGMSEYMRTLEKLREKGMPVDGKAYSAVKKAVEAEKAVLKQEL